MPRNTKRFQENLYILLDELRLANRWDKTSILLTIHKSMFSREKTRLALKKRLENTGNSVIDIEVNKLGTGFVNSMLDYKNRENKVFFITNIEWGGGKDGKDTYRVLNLHRETFVENRLKAVFFLTEREASHLPTFAPDFWAFRHRVLEFSSPHTRFEDPLPVGLMKWHKEYPFLTPIEIRDKITTTLKLLTETPAQTEVAAIRTDMQYELGFYFWLDGNLSASENALRNGKELADRYNFLEQLIKFHNGLAIISYEVGNTKAALEFILPWIDKGTKDCALLMNYGIVLSAMNKKSDAIIEGKKAIRYCPNNPRLWNTLGFLYLYSGKLDEATTCFWKAIEISSKSGFFYESLAICYLALGHLSGAHQQLQYAQQYTENRSAQQTILRAYISDDPESALLIIKKAIEKGQVSEIEVLRDPNIYTAAALRKRSKNAR